MNHNSFQNGSRTTKGFIALFSAILISCLLIFLVTTSSTASFFARFDSLNVGLHTQARLLSHGCAHIALAKLSENYFYTPHTHGDAVSIGNGLCTILSVATTSALSTSKIVTVRTEANVRTIWADTILTANISNPAVIPPFPIAPAIGILSETVAPP